MAWLSIYKDQVKKKINSCPSPQRNINICNFLFFLRGDLVDSSNININIWKSFSPRLAEPRTSAHERRRSKGGAQGADTEAKTRGSARVGWAAGEEAWRRQVSRFARLGGELGGEELRQRAGLDCGEARKGSQGWARMEARRHEN